MKTLREYMQNIDARKYQIIKLENLRHYQIDEFRTPSRLFEIENENIFSKYNHWYVVDVKEAKTINYFARYDESLTITIVRNPKNL